MSFDLKKYLAENKLNEAEGKDLYNTAGQMISQVGLFTQENADEMEADGSGNLYRFFDTPEERDELIRSLNLKCKICGFNHPSALDFHHIDPKEKFKTVSDLKWSGCSHETFITEIKKCDVLCSNCHRIEHWNKKLSGGEKAYATEDISSSHEDAENEIDK